VRLTITSGMARSRAGHRRPTSGRQAVHQGIAGQQPAPGLGLFISQDHARARRAGSQRGNDTRQTATSHQHVGKGKALAQWSGSASCGDSPRPLGFADVPLKCEAFCEAMKVLYKNPPAKNGKTSHSR